MHDRIVEGRMDEGAAPLISIVDDDESFCRSLARFVRSLGHRVATYPSAEAFLGSASAVATACVISDLNMPGMNGLELQRRLADVGIAVPVIFVTARAEPRARVAALEAGALAFLEKPFSEDALIACIERALGK
jgi:FixJ family two-component response regulator